MSLESLTQITTVGIKTGITLSEPVLNGNVSVAGTSFNFSNLPTSDPRVAGVLWRNGSDLKISVG
tara:strand:- start:245 stop:439 length:195 start_codon:yes stop_codon:yes gene_type:complete